MSCVLLTDRTDWTVGQSRFSRAGSNSPDWFHIAERGLSPPRAENQVGFDAALLVSPGQLVLLHKPVVSHHGAAAAPLQACIRGMQEKNESVSQLCGKTQLWVLLPPSNLCTLHKNEWKQPSSGCTHTRGYLTNYDFALVAPRQPAVGMAVCKVLHISAHSLGAPLTLDVLILSFSSFGLLLTWLCGHPNEHLHTW